MHGYNKLLVKIISEPSAALMLLNPNPFMRHRSRCRLHTRPREEKNRLQLGIRYLFRCL